MKRTSVLTAVLLAIGSVAVAVAPSSWARVCQPDGVACTSGGTYPASFASSAPPMPSNLTVTAVDPYDIRLNWQYISNGETGFEINNGVVSNYAGPNSRSYTWGGLAPDTYMCFKIRAYNSAGDSNWDPNVSPWYVCTTTPNSQPNVFPPPIPTPNYAGWSISRAHGYTTYVIASWIVPKVSCPLIPPDTVTRAAVWVGMWGNRKSLEKSTAWLPQIGTVSACWQAKGHVLPSAHYYAVWEMATKVAGGGARIGGRYVGPGQQVINGMTIHPGDNVGAWARYLGQTSKGYLKYQLVFFDASMKAHGQLKSFAITVTTAIPVPDLSDIMSQAGAIVENDAVTTGLAQFKAVYIGALAVTGGSGPYIYQKWILRVNGQDLAYTSPLAINPRGTRPVDFSVIWHHTWGI